MLWEHIFAFTKWFQYHCNCGPSNSQLQWLGEEEARTNWDAIIAKCRTAHANMAKLQLKASEISMGTGVSESHKSVLAKIEAYNATLTTKVADYAHIITTHAIPGIQQPTTTELLKAKIETDHGEHTFMEAMESRKG